MAILTGKPSTLAPATISSSITLAPSTLITQMSISDSYWADSNNWSQVRFKYVDNTGHQHADLSFDPASPVSTFRVSSKAKQNVWACKGIVITDFDGDSYVIQRASFTSAAEFDITIGTPAPESWAGANINQTGLVFHFDPSKANGGTAPFAAGAATAGQSVYDSGPSHRAMIMQAIDALAHISVPDWAGTGTNGSPYALVKASRTRCDLELTTAVGFLANAALTFGIWFKADASNANVVSGQDPYSSQWAVEIDNDKVWLKNENGARNVAISGVNPCDGNWHYVTLTVSTANLLTVYVDGVSKGTSASNGSSTHSFKSFGGYPVSASGSFEGSFGAKGSYSDTHIYDTALSGSDVLANFNATKAAFGL